MLVKDRMSSDVVTVTKTANIMEAEKLMKEKGIRRLPVVEGKKLIGIVTLNDLLEAEPSKATTLSRFEITYLLSRMTVAEIMKKNVITVKPDIPIEEAALIMKKNDIGGLPVISGSEVVGLITESDIFEVLVETLGVEEGGTRITLELPMKAGVLHDVTGVIKAFNVQILSLATFQDPGKHDFRYVVVRIATNNPDPILGELEKQGYQVTHVWVSPEVTA